MRPRDLFRRSKLAEVGAPEVFSAHVSWGAINDDAVEPAPTLLEVFEGSLEVNGAYFRVAADCIVQGFATYTFPGASGEGNFSVSIDSFGDVLGGGTGYPAPDTPLPPVPFLTRLEAGQEFWPMVARAQGTVEAGSVECLLLGTLTPL